MPKKPAEGGTAQSIMLHMISTPIGSARDKLSTPRGRIKNIVAVPRLFFLHLLSTLSLLSISE